MKVEVAVLGPNKPYGFCACTLKLILFTELGSCVKVKEEVNVLGSPSLTVRTVSVDVKQHRTKEISTTMI